ncbi:hypothetical protein CDL12_23382 [Handroanthus impetiginosus]|uniref:Uncharacterized protein n=1 Tax=Handroanthus impetiginosus TaxID=429701 RepID=A0A2G9GFW7_9LAMI|nr:hypothetical protein CDL12_23382 [Handroanthus impetiginosus]
MYNPIFAKSFSQYDRKRFSFGALILCFIIALSICSTFKPQLHPLSLIGDAFRMRLSINAVEDMFVMDDTSDKSEQPVRSPEQMSIDVNDTNAISQPIGTS